MPRCLNFHDLLYRQTSRYVLQFRDLRLAKAGDEIVCFSAGYRPALLSEREKSSDRECSLRPHVCWVTHQVQCCGAPILFEEVLINQIGVAQKRLRRALNISPLKLPCPFCDDGEIGPFSRWCIDCDPHALSLSKATHALRDREAAAALREMANSDYSSFTKAYRRRLEDKRFGLRGWFLYYAGQHEESYDRQVISLLDDIVRQERASGLRGPETGKVTVLPVSETRHLDV